MTALTTLLLLLELAQEVAPRATESYRGRVIREVRLEHPGGPPPDASRELIELAPGEPYRPEAVRRSIQQLFFLGVFSDIKVEASPAGDNGREVSVLFRLFPRLEVAGVEVQGLEVESGLEDLRAPSRGERARRRGSARGRRARRRGREALGAAPLRRVSLGPRRARGILSISDGDCGVHVDPGVRARLGTLTIGESPLISKPTFAASSLLPKALPIPPGARPADRVARGEVEGARLLRSPGLGSGDARRERTGRRAPHADDGPAGSNRGRRMGFRDQRALEARTPLERGSISPRTWWRSPESTSRKI